MLNYVVSDGKENYRWQTTVAGSPVSLVSTGSAAFLEVSPAVKSSVRKLGLWDFSVRFYEREGIAPLCLAWQDELGVDVTVLLLAAWAAFHGQALVAADISFASKEIASWRIEILEPLRKMRRRLKEDPSPAASADVVNVRNLIKSAELEAERVALTILERSLGRQMVRTDDLTLGQIATRNIANVRKYFSIDHVSDEMASQKFVDAIVALRSETL